MPTTKEDAEMPEVGLSPDLYDSGPPKAAKKSSKVAGKGAGKGTKSKPGSKKVIYKKKEVKGKENKSPGSDDSDVLLGRLIEGKSKKDKMKKRKSPTPKKPKKSPLGKAKSKKKQEEELPSAGESSEDEMNHSADEEEIITQMVDDSQAEYIAFTSGDADLHDLVLQGVKLLGRFEVCDRQSDEAVGCHVYVLGNGGRRTGKLLDAIALDWVLASISEGKWKPLEEYEATDIYPGAKIARESNGSKAKGLFNGGKVGIAGTPRMPMHEISSLVESCKGTLSDYRCDYLIVARNATWSEMDEMESSKCSRVTEKWFFDSIAHWKLQPVPPNSEIVKAMS
ncbi:hypothetical protein NDN08_000059 [Rhodosorus marinus]|uniref:BRCT domain-containing protein n=1 Tax=Rhodosorus marinus TaxID=101924 RepID=A0AAV8UI65_9RHOD|nr:hypothetical protein NDN08_000059 [Rhodosorus marinus]